MRPDDRPLIARLAQAALLEQQAQAEVDRLTILCAQRGVSDRTLGRILDLTPETVRVRRLKGGRQRPGRPRRIAA